MVVLYFDIYTDLVEREAKLIMEFIPHDFPNVADLQDIEFIDSSRKPTLISDLANHASNITLFTFSFAVNTSDDNQQFSSNIIFLEFSLKLP